MNPNKLYHKNYTCLDYLMLSHYPSQTIEIFTDYGADLSIKNYEDKIL